MVWCALILAGTLGLFLARRVARGKPTRPLPTLRRAGAVALAGLGVLCLAAGGGLAWYYHRPRPAPVRRALFRGITYVRDVRREPRPMVIHVAEIDLRAPGLRFLVTPDSPDSGRMLKARRTREFLREFHLQLAINANYFYPFKAESPWDYYPHAGDPVTVCGIAASRGKVYSPERWRPGTLYLSQDNRARFDEPDGPVFNAVAGNGLLLKRGEPQRPFDADDRPYPRAALALDREERRLLLVVIDGKQPNYSEGATLDELTRIVAEYGGYTAARLDEGGSSTLAAEGAGGEAVLLNCPINSRIPYRERPVANHLGVFVEPAP